MNKKEYSRAVSQALDEMGYATEKIKSRQKCFQIFTNAILDEKNNSSFRLILAGSKAEGLTNVFEENTDFDVMYEMKGFLCSDSCELSDAEKNANVILLKTMQEESAPGYTLVVYPNNLKSSEVDRAIKDCFQRFPTINFKADITNAEISKHIGNYVVLGHLHELLNERSESSDESISGPAVKTDLKEKLTGEDLSVVQCTNFCFSMDSVPAILYKGGVFLQKWVMRKRPYEWPSKNLIEEISQMNGHVVPVGIKGSEASAEQWRICYTQAELKLTDSLNHTQMHLYVLLKVVTKKILKSVSKNVSSYMIKNVVFWMAEKIPQAKFVPETLMSFVMVSLKFLRYMLEKNWFPNYMIPERNMAQEKLSKPERDTVIQCLNEITAQGFNFVQNFKELKDLNKMVDNVRNKRVEVHEVEHSARMFKKAWPELLMNFDNETTNQGLCMNTLIQMSVQFINDFVNNPQKTKHDLQNVFCKEIPEELTKMISQNLKTLKTLKERQENGQTDFILQNVIYTREPSLSDQPISMPNSFLMDWLREFQDCTEIQDFEKRLVEISEELNACSQEAFNILVKDFSDMW